MRIHLHSELFASHLMVVCHFVSLPNSRCLLNSNIMTILHHLLQCLLIEMSHRFCWSSDPHPNKYVILRGKWEWSTITISWNSIPNDHQPLIWMTTNDRTSTSGYFQYYTHSPTEIVEEKTWSENKVGTCFWWVRNWKITEVIDWSVKISVDFIASP